MTESETPHRGRDHAIAQATKTCIEFGFYGTNRPPAGHWLTEMWEFGADLAAKTGATDAARYPVAAEEHDVL